MIFENVFIRNYKLEIFILCVCVWNYNHYNSHNSTRWFTSGFGDHPQPDIDSEKKGEAGHFISLSQSYKII